MRFMKIAVLATTTLPLSSYAALGGAPVAAASLPLALRAAAPPVSTTAYSVRQTVDANGVTIREYLLPANVVFAVSWDGPVRPNMRALLGSYFTNYVAAGQNGVRSSGPLIEGNDDFRIESAGRLLVEPPTFNEPRFAPVGSHTNVYKDRRRVCEDRERLAAELQLSSVERLHKTMLNGFYRITFRRKIYDSIATLQTDLDAWLDQYNNEREHQGRWCYGRTPMRTFLDSPELAKEKLIPH
ncbi:MAG: Transposase, ISSod13 [uncultured Paraburkholderia sp.]|nr:MAG: Transposase, ISSod13 [uncultured Paraburkholderia sp.]CAH2937445.1 MAG: Transposase, ISSod13 [uncultured Paraburkholderia sp.]